MKVSNEILSVLSAAELSGNSLVLQGQLDRNTYVAVNKVLEAAGWKWNRKAKAHTCDGDAVDVLEQVLLTGVVTVAKDEFEFFPTPRAVVAELIELADIRPGMAVLEPSAGKGAIAYAVAEITKPDCVELMEANFAAITGDMKLGDVIRGDFLQIEPLRKYDRVVMNPPFSRQKDIKHVMHAFKFLKAGGRLVSVMSNGVTFRNDRLTNEFRALVESSEGEIAPLPEGAFKESGTMVNTVIVTLNS
jgi:predicted RNA methylase